MTKFYFLQKVKTSLLCLLGSGAMMLSAQNFSAFGLGMVDDSSPINPLNNYQIISYNGERLGFYFTNLPDGAWGNVKFTLYFEGDDGDPVEYLTAYDETGDLSTTGSGSMLGSIGPNSGGDCAPEDSAEFIIPASTLNSWLTDDTVFIYLDPTYDIDLFCTNNWARVKISYNYCIFGVPATYANFTLTDSIACPSDSPIALSGVPAGGTFSGPGVSGSTFNPSSLATGTYLITYQATDAIGCITEDYQLMTINSFPVISDVQICVGDTAVLQSSYGYTIWSHDAAFTNVIDTIFSDFHYGPLDHSTTIYAAGIDYNNIFMIDTLTADSFMVVDHDLLTGDDRAGIAVTDSFVFINGDVGAVRYDLNMGSPSITLPQRDGMFSDLRSAKLWSLWNNAAGSGPNSAPPSFTVTHFRSLNNDLSFGSEMVTLSTPVTIYGHGMICPGYGFVIMYSSSGNFYVVDMDNGNVTDLGVSPYPNYYYTESWLDWGVGEFNGSEYSIVYRSSAYYDAITRYEIPSGNMTIVADFPGGLNDMGNITYAPWNHRWYFHHEGSSGTFGGISETGGNAFGTHITSPLGSGSSSCYVPVHINITDINLGNDTVVCSNATPLILEVGLGYSSYTWNGVNNNWNIYPVTTSGQYVVDAIDNIGCHIMDTISVTVDACLDIEENEDVSLQVYPNPSNGAFNLQLNVLQAGLALVEITDMQGRSVYKHMYELTEGATTFPMQLHQVTGGVYMVNVRLNDSVKTYRLIINP